MRGTRNRTRPLGAGYRGTVTAETAIALPAVVLVLVAVLTVAAAGTAHLRAADGARAAARAAAIGEDEHTVRATALRVAGDDATLTMTPGEPWTEVEVSVPVAGSWLGALRATGRAVAWTEPAGQQALP